MPSPSARPALLGGSRAVTLDGRAGNRWPILTDKDEAAVLQVLRDGDLSLHPVTQQLEADFCRYFGVRHALAHCNGTAAMFAAFWALQLQPGDEVLVPSATHWASVVPMLWVGALPVFCESEPDRLGLDPADVERKITPRTRALVIVHLWGLPARMTELLALARQYGLKVVEDASHAPGATWRGRKCGTLGDIAVFSLQGNKLVPAGEGGVFLTNSEEHLERATLLGDMMRILKLPPTNPARRFAGTTFGIKTRMAPLSAAVAGVQLQHLNERNARRNDNLRYLSKHLEHLGFGTFLPPDHVERVYFEYLIRSDPERVGLPLPLLVEALRAEGCDVEPNRYPLLHQQPLFTEGHYAHIARLQGRPDTELPTYAPNALPATEAGSRRLLKLPSFPAADRALLDQYVEAFEKVRAHAEEITAFAARRVTP